MWHQDPVGTALPVACHSQNGNYKNGEWDLAGHRARLRETFGNTTSDEFVDVMLGKLVEALRPSPFDHLDEPTLECRPRSHRFNPAAIGDGRLDSGRSYGSRRDGGGEMKRPPHL